MKPEPIAIVAAGAITPIGENLDTFWSGLVTGSDGITAIERFAVDGMRVGRGGEIKKVELPIDAPAVDCRASRLLIAAAADLLGRTTVSCAPTRLAVVTGTALGGVEELEYGLSDNSVRRVAGGLYDSPVHTLAQWLGARGPVMTISTACASGATAIGVGADLLHADAADLVIAGGYDVLCRFVMRGFDALRSLTRDRVRPFDRRRSGLLLGEAAALVLLARESDSAGARLGRLLGHASGSDGSHIAAPDPHGRGLEFSIRRAMEAAGVRAADIDFVSAHGTGTPLNDRIETGVLKRVLGVRAHQIPVNSIKAAMGHTMGAAATLEAIMCLLASRYGVIPPTLGFEEGDAECDLDYVPVTARPNRTRVALSTSLGFGGCNAALILEGCSVDATEGSGNRGEVRWLEKQTRPWTSPRSPDPAVPPAVTLEDGARVQAVGVLTGWGEGVVALPDDAKAAARGRAVIPLQISPPSGERFRRATRECVLGVAAVDAMLRRAGVSREEIRGERTALIYCTAGAYGASNRAFIAGAAGASASAAGALHFPYTAPSAVPAEVAIEFGLTGSYVILIGGATATIDGLWQAATLVGEGSADRAIVLAVETFTECAELFRRARWLLGSPLVEAAAAAMIVPGPERPTYRPEGPSHAAEREPEQIVATRGGEMLGCAPLLVLALAQESRTASIATGRWRGRHASIEFQRESRWS